MARAEDVLKRSSTKGLAIPRVVEVALQRYSLPMAVQEGFLRVSRHFNALMEEYKMFLAPTATKSYEEALVFFRADYPVFVDALGKLRKVATTLEKADREALLEGLQGFENFVNDCRDVIEPLGKGLVGAGHLVPLAAAARKAVIGLETALRRVDRALANAAERLRFPDLARLLMHCPEGSQSADFVAGVEMILRRLEREPKLLKIPTDRIRDALRHGYQGIASDVEGKIVQPVARAQPLAYHVEKQALKRALAGEYGLRLRQTGWSKIEVPGSVNLTKLSGKTAGEFFDGSTWLYRLNPPETGLNPEMDAIAKVFEEVRTFDPAAIDGLACLPFGVESKAGRVGAVMEQFGKAATRMHFGVVELPVPGLGRPGRFLVVPPPGFPTEIVLLSPRLASLERQLKDVSPSMLIGVRLHVGTLPLSKSVHRDAARQLIELVILAMSGR